MFLYVFDHETMKYLVGHGFKLLKGQDDPPCYIFANDVSFQDNDIQSYLDKASYVVSNTLTFS